MFEEAHEKPNRESRTERILVYIVVWLVLAWPVGTLVYNYWYAVGLFGTPESDGVLPYFIWLVVATVFITPYLTSKVIDRLYPTQAAVRLTVRQRVAALLRSVWEFFRDIKHIFRTIVPCVVGSSLTTRTPSGDSVWRMALRSALHSNERPRRL